MNNIKWAAQLTDVREVSILGTADLNFWKEQLLKENLSPAESDGQAQLLLIAADSKYMGIAFQELSVSVLISRPEIKDAAYLIHAFNSSKLFAFCERVFFATPYSHAGVRVSAAHRISIKIFDKREGIFYAEMEANSRRQPLSRGADGWAGPVFLPRQHRQRDRQGKLFVARLKGFTERYSFDPSKDSVTISPSSDNEALKALRDSHFVAGEWIIRESAEHAKSKTYKRSKMNAFESRRRAERVA